jgi:antitoxin MazE
MSELPNEVEELLPEDASAERLHLSLAPSPASLKANLCATHTEMLQRRKLRRSAAILGALVYPPDIRHIRSEKEREMRARIARWGNSLGVRVPRQLAREAGLAEGVEVELQSEGGRIVITPRPGWRLNDLLEGMSPDAMAEAFDWGPDLGREGGD